MLKKLFSVILVAIAVFAVGFGRPALADAASPDAANGAKIFSANCIACHMGGNNVIMADKTLKGDALNKYLFKDGEDHLASIVNQVTNGKNAMPAFAGRLNPDQIADVAAYVLQQSEKGW